MEKSTMTSLQDINMPNQINLSSTEIEFPESLVGLSGTNTLPITVPGAWQELVFKQPTFVSQMRIISDQKSPDVKVEVKTVSSLRWEAVDEAVLSDLSTIYKFGVITLAIRLKSKAWRRQETITGLEITGLPYEQIIEVGSKLDSVHRIKTEAINEIAAAETKLQILQQNLKSEETAHQQRLMEINKSILDGTKTKDDFLLEIKNHKSEAETAQAAVDKLNNEITERKQALEQTKAEHINLKESVDEKLREKQRLESQIHDLQVQVREELRNKSLIVSTLDGFQKKCSRDLIFYYVISAACFYLGLSLFNKITAAVLSLGDLSKYNGFWEMTAATFIRVPTATIFLTGLTIIAGILTWALRSIATIQREQRKFARIMPVVVEIAENVTTDLNLSPQDAALVIAKTKIHFIKDTVLEIGKEEADGERESPNFLYAISGGIRDVLPSQKRLPSMAVQKALPPTQ